MTDKAIFVYKMKQPASVPVMEADAKLQFRKWHPGINKFIPPNSPVTYFYLWIMHILHIFRNNDYAAYSIIKDEKDICSLVCVPALYKWPFMNRYDLQIKNVYTHEEYRGKGYASRLIQYTLREMSNEDRVFWYMTHEDNIPSQKLCSKIGFEFVGTYRRKRNKYFFYEGEIIQDK